MSESMSNDNLPDDALGTVRADPSGGALAVRCRWGDDGNPTWVVVDISQEGDGFNEIVDVSSWPVVHRRYWLTLAHSPDGGVGA